MLQVCMCPVHPCPGNMADMPCSQGRLSDYQSPGLCWCKHYGLASAHAPPERAPTAGACRANVRQLGRQLG